MTKRFTDVACRETGHIYVDDYGIEKEFTCSAFEDFLNELADENKQLKSENKRLKRLTASYIWIDINKVLPIIAECKGITVEEYLEEIERIYKKGVRKNE